MRARQLEEKVHFKRSLGDRDIALVADKGPDPWAEYYGRETRCRNNWSTAAVSSGTSPSRKTSP
jgi:hypothetical protein